MAYYLGHWLIHPENLGSKPLGGSMVDLMETRRLGDFGDLLGKSKLSSRSGSANLRQLHSIHEGPYYNC